jgi:hypothetical protein
MHILISMDDTDDKESRGTGQLAQLFSKNIEASGLGTCSAITRHQLFVHDNIPYTSHNSAMCFEARIGEQHLQQIIEMGMSFLEAERADGSDPGFCVVVVDESLKKDQLIEFGLAAKKTVLSKTAAYHLANTLGIHLTEHGGTGGGVIGALAGTGLRLSGNDGRFRGWLSFGRAGETTTAGALRAHHFVDDVRSATGVTLQDNTPIILGDDTVKIVYKDRKQILPVIENTDSANTADWKTLTRKQTKEY